ncbi:hypothetical protein LRAMOSA07261 [Lichtheimia ramosa]|uniref:Uncharacterized protein n=1 Tax=Lichtheimia ramosa TaxID=688394 RepID=A0A077WAD5_9FUNG|nr:hypothetical protein LRAMOSA07261 [Lichtheimia ramosa]
MPAVTPITVTHESPLSAPSYYHAIFEPGMTYPDSIPENEPLLVSGVNIGQHYTFARLRRDVLTFSTILREEFNVKRQDVVTLYAPNDIDYMAAMHGSMAAGAISVVVPIECHESQEVADICKQACPVVALTHSSVLETMKDALVKCDMSNIKLIIIGQDAVHDPENNLYSFQKLVEEPRDGEAMKMDPEDIAYTMCTSGTTGPRKLAAISHRAAIRRLSTVPCPPMTNTDNYFLACQPVSAIIGNIGTQVRIQRRVRTLICESPLPIERLCTVIEKFKVEQMTALMWTLLELARSSVVDRFDMSSLKFILSGGQHVPDPVRETIKKRLDTDLVSIYGGTEAWIVSSKSLGDNVPKECEGKITPGYEVRVVDDDGKDVEPYEPGELWVKGPMTASMYYGRPDVSAKAFGKDGYYHTGDYFTIDKLGHLRYCGRQSDRIRAKYKTFPPMLLEDLCHQYSDKIKECCVVGAYSKQNGFEQPRAYIVLIEDHGLNEQQKEEFLEGLTSYINNNVSQADMKLDGGAKFLSRLPLTKSEKLDRMGLRLQAEVEIE